jgi:hypothetical protein
MERASTGQNIVTEEIKATQVANEMKTAVEFGQQAETI